MTKNLQATLAAKLGTVAELKKDLQPAAKPTSAADRREQLKKAIAEMDGEKIDQVRDVMTRYVDSMVTLDPEQTTALTPAQSKALMEEDILRREIADLVEARKETIKEGRIPLHTFRADVDYCLTEALTKVGILGIKVWICHGIVYGKRDLFEIAGASAHAGKEQAPRRDGKRDDRRKRRNNNK